MKTEHKPGIDHNGISEDYRVKLPATYKRQWDDGFGARGWKLDASMDDPMVIASTAETGDRIPTSVFVHDILDHYLAGLAMSGHRNEAIALSLLADRTGVSPLPDFTQMTEEDILRGNVNGEAMASFLPAELVEQVPEKYRRDNKLLMGFLLGALGEERLKPQLVDNFTRLGRQALAQARQQWETSGLDFDHRDRLGLCIQRLLESMDAQFRRHDSGELHGYFLLGDRGCALQADDGRILEQHSL